jgi:5'-deoxynucleotidase YfbR-like HD superfamily hydrolase
MEQELSDALHIGELALGSGRVYRQVSHADGKPESDTDHAVMLTWLACSLAARWYPQLDIGLVAQLASAHDVCEVYAGDDYAVDRTPERAAAKAAREAAAIERIGGELPSLPWLAAMARAYERQDTAEARFVKAVDKVCPKIVLRVTGELNARLLSMGWEQVTAFRDAETAAMDVYAADFPEILALRETFNELLAPTFQA